MGKGRRKEKDVSNLQSQESKRYLNPEMLECTAPEYKLREVVLLPEGIIYNEWLASHCLAFFDHINLIYGTISEFCTNSGCPDMIGPGNRLYLWIDEKGKRIRLSAPQYIDYVMTYTQTMINDESVFPTKFDREFPSWFESVVKKILLLLFHVLAHIYYSHFKEIEFLNLYSETNCIFAHFMLFNYQFFLIDDKETQVLQDLAIALRLISPSSSLVIHHPQTDFNQFEPTSNLKATDSFISEVCENRSFEEEKVITTQCQSISPFISNNDLENYPKKITPFKVSNNCSMTKLKSDKVQLPSSNIKSVDENHYLKLDNRRCFSASAVFPSSSYSSAKDSSSKPFINSIKKSNSSGNIAKLESNFFEHHPILEMKSISVFKTSSILNSNSQNFLKNENLNRI